MKPSYGRQRKKVSWNGEEIPPGPWYDHHLFTVADFDVKVKEGSGTVIFILVVVGICAYVICRKRKRIAIEVRRLSSRASVISKHPG